jgi:hypothetical protein
MSKAEWCKGSNMTTYSKVKQTLVSLEGAKATMEMIGQITQEEQASKSLRRNSQKMDIVIERIQKRVKTMELEEPDYKGL